MSSFAVRVLAFFGLLGACVLMSAAARAEPMSPYEGESLEFALTKNGTEIDPDPANKWIEGVDVVTLPVFEKRDPLPGFLNWFHATSRHSVIEQEMLLRTGDKFDPALVEETERNLRSLPQLSVVLIAATKGSAPDRVRLLVVTKDVWSLRVNWEPVFVNGALQSLYLQPSEENLLGRHKVLDATVLLDRPTYTVGLGFSDPRIGGSRLATSASANVIVNCRTGEAEGSTGGFQYGKPLYSSLTKWGWVAAAKWEEGVVRPAGTTGQSICSGDRAVGLHFRGTPQNDIVPYQYREDDLESQFSLVRSYGSRWKNDVSFGLESHRRVYESPDLSASPRIVQTGFQGLLPANDTRLSPFVELHSYDNRFLRVLDFETLGLQEDYQLGHDLWLKAYPAAHAISSTRDLVGFYAGLGYTLALGDGLLRAYGTSVYQVSRPGQSDGQVLAGGRIVSPRLPFGRVVLDGYILDHYENYLNQSLSVGGTTRLRGYRTQAFVGSNLAVANVEVRSRPVEILAVEVGLAAFFDIGDAARSFDSLVMREGVGGGLRFAFPQVQRTVLRLDVGVPLEPHDPAADLSFVARFEQAFDMPTVTSLLVPDLVQPGLVQ